MSAFQWNDRFKINVEHIDRQHKNLFAIISRAQKAIHSVDSDRAIGLALIELADYSHQHFGSEEELMRKIEFAEFLRHRTMHAGFTKWLTDMILSIRQGRAVNICEFISYLKRWWEDHILCEDKKIGRALATQVEKADSPV